MTNEEAVDLALRMTHLQRAVILACERGRSWGYDRIAEGIGAPYSEVRQAGLFLQREKLARVSHVRHGQEFAGSAIFLNQRGEVVKAAAQIIEKRNRANAQN